jgi:hypothetical protein
MKQEIANWSFLIGGIIAILSIVIKFILWLSLRSPKRISFLRSFVVWFSKNDIHDASSNRTRTFLYWSNLINFFFWFGIFVLLIGFVNDTDPVETQPVNRKR